jgi:hypothetical protein
MRSIEKGWQARGLVQLGVVLPMVLVANVVLVAAQQVTGVPGSPSATTTIDGKQIPPPPPKFGGVIKDSAKDSTPGGHREWCLPRALLTCSSS